MSVRGVCGARPVCPGGGVVPGSVGGVPPPVPGLTTTENSCSPPAAVLVVAVREAAVPVGTAAPESASRELTLPLPVDAGLARVVLVAGLVQVWVVEDFSLQELTSQEFAWVTAAVGETWLV